MDDENAPICFPETLPDVFAVFLSTFVLDSKQNALVEVAKYVSHFPIRCQSSRITARGSGPVFVLIFLRIHLDEAAQEESIRTSALCVLT
jgi:hypothetical protein